MSGGTRIISLASGKSDSAEAESAGNELLLTQDEAAVAAGTGTDDAQSEEPLVGDRAAAPRPGDRIAPVAAALLAACWTAFFIWAEWGKLASGADAATLAQAIGQWAAPVLLIGVGWLLLMRNSSREARRFADVGSLLSHQSRELEERLVTVNRELSLAREFIAAQARDLDSLGRMATERLSQHADRLHDLIHENGARLDAIGSVSAAAMENMDRLRGQLPVIASSTKDLTNNIGQAGRTAQSQIEQMVRGFERINEFGEASERQMHALQAMVDNAQHDIARQAEEFDSAMQSRLTSLREQDTAFRAQLETREVEALAAIRSRAAALAEELEDARKSLDSREAEILVSLRSRISALHDESQAVSRSLRDGESRATAAWQEALDRFCRQADELDTEIEERQTVYFSKAGELAAQSKHVMAELARYETQLAGIAAHTREAGENLLASTGAVADHLRDGRDSASQLTQELAALTDGSVRLLELIRASADHSRDDLPSAIAAGEARLDELDKRASQLRGAVSLSFDQSEALVAVLEKSHERIAALAGELDGLQTRVASTGAEHAGLLHDLRQSLVGLDSESAALADRAQTVLASAIAELSDAGRKALADIEENSAPAISRLARQLGEESAASLDRAMRVSAAETAGKLEQATAHAAGASREAVIQLRDQLAKVNELTGNLERRVAQARERAEEQVDNEFSRRAALITESLNSSAIDIAKALSTDVSDTAWASYLRGDRGIFTRRAVRLLDGAETRAIAQIYENDSEFRDHVSHYIHDFEAILRQVLSTRDGHALGVTLLSSDMGKLYVALAQGIERFRA